MKRCACCGEVKSYDAFPRDASRKDGLYRACKLCKSLQDSSYYAANSLRIKARQKDYLKNYYVENQNRIKARTNAWKAANKKRSNSLSSTWRKANPDRHAALASRHRASKYQATPAWANAFFIKEIYALAALRTKMTGIKWHVDHVVPLRSKFVCGLHCEANLAVIPATANLSKGNRIWPDMP